MTNNFPVEVHPIANIFPMMSDEEFAGLKSDIEANGVRECVVLWNGKLIDGRNRMAAMLELNIDWNEYASELDADVDPVAYAISHNLHRRQLNTSQRAMVAARLREMFDDEAKERRKATEGRPKKGEKKLPANSPEVNSDARDAAGRSLNVGGKSVDAATTVLETENAELIEAVDQGKVAVSTAAAILKSDQESASELVERIKRGDKIKPPKPQAPVWEVIAKKIESAELLFGDNAQQVRQAEKVKRRFSELVEAFDEYVKEVET